MKAGFRLFNVGVPMAALLATMLGRGEDALAMWLAALAVPACTLGASEAFPRCAAKQLSDRKVSGALLMALGLTAIAAAALIFVLGSLTVVAIDDAAVLTASAVRDDPTVPDIGRSASLWLTAGAFLTGLRCLEERFAAQGDRVSARVTDALTFIGLSMCLLIGGDTPLLCAGCSGGLFALCGLLALCFRRREWPKGTLSLFRELPVGLLRLMLYPALCLLALMLCDAADVRSGGALRWAFAAELLPPVDPELAAFFLGGVVLELSRSVFRRSRAEAGGFRRGLSLSLLLISGLAMLLAAESDGAVTAFAAMLPMAAGLCAMALYGPQDGRGLAGEALLALCAAAMLLRDARWRECPVSAAAMAVIVCAVLNLLAIPDWMELFRQRRAARIRRRALRNAGRMRAR